MKNKLFICFKPLVIDSKGGDDENHVDYSDVSCLIVANDDQSKNASSSTVKSSLWDSRNGKAVSHRHKKKKPQKALYPGLNAIFDFSTRTSVRDRNIYQLAMLSKNDRGRTRGKRLDLLNDKPALNPKAVEANDGNSNTRKVVSPSSASLSNQAKMRNCCIHGSRPCSPDKKAQNTTPTSERNIGFGPKSCSVFYLILFSLFCTMFLGRVCAVLLTSLWLYFKPQWSLKSAVIAREGHQWCRTKSTKQRAINS